MTNAPSSSKAVTSDLPPSFAEVARQQLLHILARDYPDVTIDIDRIWVNLYELKPANIPPFTSFPEPSPSPTPLGIRKLSRAISLIDSLIEYFLGHSTVDDTGTYGLFGSPYTVVETERIGAFSGEDILYIHARFKQSIADAYSAALRDYWNFVEADGQSRSAISLNECMQALTLEAQVGVEQGNLTLTHGRMLESMLGYCRDQENDPLQQHGVFSLSLARPDQSSVDFAGCFVLSEVCTTQPPTINDARLGSVLLYTPNGGLEGFDSFTSLTAELTTRWADPQQKDWLLKSAEYKYVEPEAAVQQAGVSCTWAFSPLSGDFLKQQFGKMVMKQLSDFAHCTALAKARALSSSEFLSLVSQVLDLRYQFDNFLNLDRNDRNVIDAATPDWWQSMDEGARSVWVDAAKAFGGTTVSLKQTINDLETRTLDSNQFLRSYIDTILDATLAKKKIQLSPDEIIVKLLYIPQLGGHLRPTQMIVAEAAGRLDMRYTLRELATEDPNLQIQGYTRRILVTDTNDRPVKGLDANDIEILMETIDVEAAFDRFLDERLKTSDFAQTLREKSGQLLLAQLRMGLLVARQMKFESSGLEWIAAVLDSPDLMPVRKAGQKNIQLKFLTINDIPLSNVMLIAPDDAGESRPVVLCTVDAPDGIVFRWFESLERLRRDFLQRSANSEYLLRQMPILRQALARQSLAFDEWFEHYRFPQVFRNWPSPIPLPTLVWEVVSFDEQRKHFIDENHDIRVEHMISDAKSYRECAKDSDSAFDFHLAASIVMLFLPPPIRIPLALGMTLYTAWQGFRKIEDNDYLGAAQEFLNALGYLLLGGVGVRSLPSRFIAPIRAPRPAPPLVRRMGPDGCEHIGFLLSPPKGPLLADAKQVTALDSKVFHAVEINHETFYIRRRFNLFGHARLYRQVSDNAQLLTYSDEFGFINSGGVWIKALYRARGIGPQILRNAYRELERLTAVWPVAVDSLSLAEKEQFESLYMGLAKSGNAELLPNILSYCEGGSASINQLLRTSVRNSKTRKFLIDLFRLNAYQGVAFRVTHVSSACMQQLKTKLGQVFMDRGVQSASITRFNASRWSQDAFITQHANSDNQMIYMIFDSSIPKKNMFSHILGDHVGVVPNTPMQLTAVREVGSNFFAYFSSPQEVVGEIFDIYTGEAETSL